MSASFALALALVSCGAEPNAPPSVEKIVAETVIADAADADTPAAESEIVPELEYEAMAEALRAEALESRGPGAPALWKVSDHDSTIYLFGTVHYLRPSTKWMTPDIQAAFDQSDRLVIETDIHSRSARDQMWHLYRHYGLFPVERSLLDYTTDEQAKKIKAAADKFDMTFDQIVQLKPWLLMSILMGETKVGPDDFKRAFGVEEVLLERARKQNKKLGYMESADAQISVVPTISLTEQVADLVEALDAQDQGGDFLDELVAEWADGDVEGLASMLAMDPTMHADNGYYEALLPNRNRNWIPKIEVLLNVPGTSFVAVGAAHLAGEDSVIKMLEEEHLIAERLYGAKVSR